MTKVYACLLGNWICLNDDPKCCISDYGKSPYLWWEEGAPIFTTDLAEDQEPSDEIPSKYDSFYYQNYVNVFYLGKNIE